MPPQRYKIVIVDDNETNLTVAKNMLKTFHEVFPVDSAAKLFALLEKITPDLILLDIEMPVMDGYEAMRILKADQRFCGIPVIFLTSRSDESSELKGLGLGAADYVWKPFSASLLLRRIENHLLLAAQQLQLKRYSESLEGIVDEKINQLESLKDAILCIVAEIVEYRDDVTGGHINRTTSFFKLLLDRVLELGHFANETADWDQRLLVASTRLHDVGKVAIPDAILNKPSKLTDSEFEIMKTHVQIGVDMIERIERNAGPEQHFLSCAKIIAGTHHERWDGSGYPLGLSETHIPLEGRIMAIADVYDALISTRPYKKPITGEEARRIIIEGRSKHFDPLLVDVFDDIASDFARVASEYMLKKPHVSTPIFA
jgi:putative two-component system response regulator